MECVPLTASTIREIQFSDEYLVDTVGLLTGVSTEKEYVTMGVVHRFITLELTDHTGKVEMALFDEYVDKFIEFLSSSAHMRPVVMVQLAVVGPVRGVLFVLHNVALHVKHFHVGAIACLPGQVHYVLTKDDFLVINLVRKIVELEKAEQGRFSIVWAKVMVVVDRTSWYPLRVHVADGQDTTHFVLLDDEVKYLVRKSCGELLDEVQLSMCYPMRRVCDDIDIMQMFQRMDKLVAPQQVDNWYRFAPLISSSNLQEQLEVTTKYMSGVGCSSGVAHTGATSSVTIRDVFGLPTPIECTVGAEKSVGDKLKKWCRAS
ncbi:hypothetical protein SESBI_44123 [Sesbania bispinosa]|nr:hypothetical protein SESBI_44123 [Sesbania bispinosa]